MKSYAAPRRLAVAVFGLADKQQDKQIEKLGPAVKAAFDKEGKPSKAAEGFARSNGVTVEELGRKETDKGERLAFISEQKGAETESLLADIVEKALAQLPIPKRMRWGRAVKNSCAQCIGWSCCSATRWWMAKYSA